MRNKKVSWDRDSRGKVCQKNTTTSRKGGGGKTVHQRANSSLFLPSSATKITGVTTHKANGQSSYKKR